MLKEGMAKAYSKDLRERALRAIDRGEKAGTIAKKLEVSRQWVHRLKKRFEETGERGSLPMGGHRKSRIGHLEAEIGSWIEEQPGITLREMSEKLEKGHAILIDIHSLWHRLKKWGITYKKKPTGHRTRSARYTTSQKRVERKPTYHGNRSAFLSG